jgi:hypothetical protein
MKSTNNSKMMEVLPLLSGSISTPKSKAAVKPTPAPKTKQEEPEEPRIPSVDEFLERFRERAASCLENAYL